MEHNLNFNDIPDTLTPAQKVCDSSQTPIVQKMSTATMFESSLKTQATNTDQQQTKIGATQTIPVETPVVIQLVDVKPPMHLPFKPITLDTEVQTKQSSSIHVQNSDEEKIIPLKREITQNNNFQPINLDVQQQFETHEFKLTKINLQNTSFMNNIIKPEEPIIETHDIHKIVENKNDALSNDLTKPTFTQNALEPKESVPVEEQGNTIETESISKQTAFDFFMNKIKTQPDETLKDNKYTKFEESNSVSQVNNVSSQPKPIDKTAELINMGLEPGSPPEFGFMPRQEQPTLIKPSPQQISIVNQVQYEIPKLPVTESFNKTNSFKIIEKKFESNYESSQKTVEHHSVLDKLSEKLDNIENVSKPPFQHEPIQIETPVQATYELPKFEPITQSFEKFEKTEHFQTSETNFEPIFRPQAASKHIEKLNDIRSPSPRPSAEGIAMEKLWASQKQNCETDKFPASQTKDDLTPSILPPSDEFYSSVKTQSINETRQIFETTMPVAQPETDLKAPALVKNLIKLDTTTTTPTQNDIVLEPGTPPVICFAPIPLDEVLHQKKPETVESFKKEIIITTNIESNQSVPPLPAREVKIEAPPLPARPEFVEPPPATVFKPAAPLPVQTVFVPVQQPPAPVFQPAAQLPVQPEYVPPPKATVFKPAAPLPAQTVFVPIQTPPAPVYKSVAPLPVQHELVQPPAPVLTPVAPLPVQTELVTAQPPQAPPVIKPVAQLPPTPPPPVKFIKSDLTESEYDSDYDSRLSATMQHYESDSEPKYRSVKPPNPIITQPILIRPQPQTVHSNQQHETFIEITKPIPPPKPKFKPLSSGYMADTEDTINRNFESYHKIESSSFASTHQEIKPQAPFQPPEKQSPPTKFYRHHIHKHDKKDESTGEYSKVRLLTEDVSYSLCLIFFLPVFI